MRSSFSQYATIILLIGSLTLGLARVQDKQSGEPNCSNLVPKNVEKAARQLVTPDVTSTCDCAKPKKSADEEALDDEESIEKPVESDVTETEVESPIQSPVDESSEQAGGELDEEKIPFEIAVGDNKNVKYGIVDEGEEEPLKVDSEAKEVVEKHDVRANKQQDANKTNSRSEKSSEKKSNNKRAKRDTKSKNGASKKGSSKQTKGKKFSKKSGKNDSSRKRNQKKGLKNN